MTSTPPKILIVDDEASLQYAFCRFFEENGWDAVSATTGRKALKALETAEFDCVFLDIRLPDVDGLELIPEMRKVRKNVPVVVMTAYGSLETALRAVDSQILEYFVKPVDLDRALEVAQSCTRSSPVTGGGGARPGTAREQFIGSTPAMQRVFRNIGLFAGADATVLVTGETGTGKEMVARAIHACSTRRAGPFVPVNCGALPEHLVESELFGFVKGAFTGAISARGGRIEASMKGTLFLDEVGELPLAAQVKLLRFLDTHIIERLGSVEPIEVDTRVVAATNRDLMEAIRDGRFREDLFYRLAVMQIQLPPLRERRQDVAALARLFLEQFGEGPPPVLSEQAVKQLMSHDWPGNVRELRNVMHHAAVVARGGVVLPSHLPSGLEREAVAKSHPGGEEALKAYLDGLDLKESRAMDQAVIPVERELIARALARFNGNQSLAAKFLGLHRNTLRNKLAQSQAS